MTVTGFDPAVELGPRVLSLNHFERRRLKFGNTRTYDASSLISWVDSMVEQHGEVHIVPATVPSPVRRNKVGLRRVRQYLRRRRAS